ncbi:MAG: pseudouridine synthase [Thermoanaerobaculaceae bacterium]|nr:pseudouridine synthase [Thermoanaerobaculaceae bacterium]
MTTAPIRPTGPRPLHSRVYAFHKPRGVVVSRVPEGRAPTLFALLQRPYCEWFAVGRLDQDSEGLVLLCDDSRVAQRLMDPGAVAKTYLVTVEGLPAEDALERLRNGGLALGTRLTRPIGVARLGKAPRGGTRLDVVLHEGINRQIRRCFHLIGHRVRRLVRVGVGPIPLGELEPGTGRELALEEVTLLLAAAGVGVSAHTRRVAPSRTRTPRAR